MALIKLSLRAQDNVLRTEEYGLPKRWHTHFTFFFHFTTVCAYGTVLFCVVYHFSAAHYSLKYTPHVCTSTFASAKRKLPPVSSHIYTHWGSHRAGSAQHSAHACRCSGVQWLLPSLNCSSDKGEKVAYHCEPQVRPLKAVSLWSLEEHVWENPAQSTAAPRDGSRSCMRQQLIVGCKRFLESGPFNGNNQTSH